MTLFILCSIAKKVSKTADTVRQLEKVTGQGTEDEIEEDSDGKDKMIQQHKFTDAQAVHVVDELFHD